MLELDREKGESISIGPNVVVTIKDVDLTTGRVSLAISAPSYIKILKSELLLSKLKRKHTNHKKAHARDG